MKADRDLLAPVFSVILRDSNNPQEPLLVSNLTKSPALAHILVGDIVKWAGKHFTIYDRTWDLEKELLTIAMTSLLKPRPDAPLGSVETLNSAWKITDFSPTDAILCRNNAPLVNVAFLLVRYRIPCNYLGRNLKEQLENLLLKLKAATTAELLYRLERYRTNEAARLRLKGKVQSAANLSDTCECLRILAKDAKDVTAVIDTLKKIFGTNGVTLSTIHKAKGLEWDTVWILDRQLIPSPWATSPTNRRQEANLLHVAITRAKLHLKYITLRDERKVKDYSCLATDAVIDIGRGL